MKPQAFASRLLLASLITASLIASPLFTRIVFAQCPATAPIGNDYSTGRWHLETHYANDITAAFHEDVHVHSLTPAAWLLVASCPPTLQGQQPLQCRYGAKTEHGYLGNTVVQEKTGLHRKYMQVTFPASKSVYADGYSADMIYAVRLFSRHLRPGPVAAPRSVPYLSPAETALYLRPNRHIIWTNSPLSEWMIQRNLRKRPHESAVQFAWRVAQAVHEDFQYGQHTWNANDACRNRYADCGGLSSVIVGALRANGVPARLNLGYWAISQSGNIPKYHVRAEFYAREAGGWVPIDGSGLTQWGARWASAFGQEDGQFITVMVDTDIAVETGAFGVQTVTQLQFPACWATGHGDFSSMQADRSVTFAYAK